MKKAFKSISLILMTVVMLISVSTLNTAFAVGNVKNLKLVSVSTSSVSIKWSKVKGADGYRIYRYDTETKKWKKLKNTTALKYTDKTVEDGSVYTYRIKAYDKTKSKTVFSKEYSNKLKVITKPEKVTGLTVSATSSDLVTLKWNKNENATGYRVYKYDASKKKYQKVADTKSATYTVTSLNASTTYKFVVKAYKKSGSAVFGAKSDAVTAKTHKPTKVTDFRFSKATENSYTLSWSASKGATGYRIAKYNESAKKWVFAANTTELSYTVSSKAANTPAKYRIRAYVKTDSGNVYSAYSSTVTARKMPSVPQGLEGAQNSDGGISLKWTADINAQGYAIYSYSAQNGQWTNIGSTEKSNFTVKNLSSTDTYRYAVSAYIYISGKKVYTDRCESVSVFFESSQKSDSIYSEEMAESGVLGYLFDPKEGCFYTSADPWQRVVGYNSIFDVAAPFTLIDFDTVRLRFEYQNKDWMIQLWKGQYGLVFYGAEVGVYTKPKDRELMHYDAASDSEMLKMSMTFLEKNSKGKWVEKFTRPYGAYWWCTGFLPGVKYGKYDRMKLDMRITVKDYEMLAGLKSALEENKISYTVKGLDVYFVYE